MQNRIRMLTSGPIDGHSSLPPSLARNPHDHQHSPSRFHLRRCCRRRCGHQPGRFDRGLGPTSSAHPPPPAVTSTWEKHHHAAAGGVTSTWEKHHHATAGRITSTWEKHHQPRRQDHLHLGEAPPRTAGRITSTWEKHHHAHRSQDHLHLGIVVTPPSATDHLHLGMVTRRQM